MDSNKLASWLQVALGSSLGRWRSMPIDWRLVVHPLRYWAMSRSLFPSTRNSSDRKWSFLQELELIFASAS